MESLRMFKFRLYPSKEQQTKMDDTIELCRRTYNDMRDTKIETYKQTGKSLSEFQLNDCLMHSKIEIQELKNVHSQVLQNTNDRLTKGFSNFFRRCKEKKEGKKVKVGFPRYKKRNRFKSFCYPQNSGFKIEGNKLYLSKIGNVTIKMHRQFDAVDNEGKPIRKLISLKNVTISKTPSGKYFASFACIIANLNEPRELDLNNSIGIDMGLKSYATLDKDVPITNPRFYRKSEMRLAHLQRRVSHKKFRSNNYQKSKIKVARLHERIANQRLDYTNKESTRITQKYSFIGVEALNIKGMSKNKKLSKSILDAGWGMFVQQLYYKAENAGGMVQKIDRFYPSTKTCSKCGNIQEMLLEERTYNCNGCGFSIDRDLNASINIRNESLRIYKNTVGITGINACGDATNTLSHTEVRQVASMNQEATLLVGW